MSEKLTRLLNEPRPNEDQSNMIRVNGKAQVVDMLRESDPAFREAILRQIERRDRKLAKELREELSF